MNKFQKVKEKMLKINPDYLKGIDHAEKWLKNASLKEIERIGEGNYITNTILNSPQINFLSGETVLFKQGFVKKVKKEYLKAKNSL